MEETKLDMNSVITNLSDAFTAIPFNKMLGLHLDEIQYDHAVMSFSMKPELIGNFLHGILHGGVISSVLDMAGGMVVMASVIQKKPSHSMEELKKTLGKCSTVDLQINYVRPGKGMRFIAKAHLVKGGNKISFTRMELYNEEQSLIATGSGTYLTG